VTRQACPTETELLHFADAGLAPEQLGRIESHLRGCTACTEVVKGLRRLTADLAAQPPGTPIDMRAHVAGIMTRIDAPAPERSNSQRRRWFVTLSIAAAAAVTVVAWRPLLREQGEFTARGARSQATFSRDVGVQVYVKRGDLEPLASGSRVARDAAFTAGLRNLAKTPAHLLLFAVDARREVHWIAPEYTQANTNPSAVVLGPSGEERLLPNAVVFDDLAEGTLRIVALIAGQPMQIADVERLTKDELNDAGIMKHFPRAELRQISVNVVRESKP